MRRCWNREEVRESQGPRVPRSRGPKDQDISNSHWNTSFTLKKVHLVFNINIKSVHYHLLHISWQWVQSISENVWTFVHDNLPYFCLTATTWSAVIVLDMTSYTTVSVSIVVASSWVSKTSLGSVDCNYGSLGINWTSNSAEDGDYWNYEWWKSSRCWQWICL